MLLPQPVRCTNSNRVRLCYPSNASIRFPLTVAETLRAGIVECSPAAEAVRREDEARGSVHGIGLMSGYC